MRVKFTTNLGVNDAAKLGLQYQQCGSGMELSVDSDTGHRLVTRRLADELVDIKAVPPIEIKAAKQEAVISKPEPAQEQPVVSAPQPVTHQKKPKEK
jgi:hypothetical protein